MGYALMIKQIKKEGKGNFEILKRGIMYMLRRISYPIGILKILNKNTYGAEKVLNFIFSNSGYIIFTMQKKEELRAMLKIIEKQKPKNILEIGTANGGTLFSICRTSPEDAKIISLDLPGGKFGGGYKFWRRYLYFLFKMGKQKLYLIRADSHTKEAQIKVAKLLDHDKLDFLFIDGDHSYGGVKKDFQMYSKFVKNKGIIAFHDINITFNDSRVYKFWKEVRKKYPSKEFIYEPEIGWAGIGIIEFNR